MEPKAKWSAYDEDTKRIWTSAVGPFYLDVNSGEGTCEIAEWEPESGSIGRTLWKHHVPTPCDVTDLMRLTESELARRLEKAAETMDGGELVAQNVVAVDDPRLCDQENPDRTANAAARNKGSRVAFAHKGPLRRTYERLSERRPAQNKTTMPEKEATVYDLGAMLGLALCFPAHAFTLNLSRRSLQAVADELIALAYDQREIVAAPNVYRTALNCLHEVMGGPTDLMQEMWSRHEEDGVFPPRNLTIVEAGAGTTCTPQHGRLVRAETPLFKVGDLVRVPSNINAPTERMHVARVHSLTAAPTVVVDFGSGLAGYEPRFVKPYTLPAINSYADLADVLDELPEGTVVQMLLPTRSPLGHAGPTDVYRYRRTQTGYEFTNRGQGWRRSESCSSRAPDELDAASFRILPPSEVER